MRTLLAFVLAPAAGLAVFTLVWAAPEIQMARGGPQLGVPSGPLAPTWLAPAYLLVLLLSVPVFRELRTVFGWTAGSAVLGAGLVYALAAVGLGAVMGELVTLLPDWPQWVGLACAALAHAAVFLSFRPGVRKYYFR